MQDSFPPPMLLPELLKPQDPRPSWTHRQVCKAPLPAADSDITHACARLHRERWESLLRGWISPKPSRFPESAPPHAKNSSCPNVPVPPPQIPCTLLQFTILNTFPQLPLQGQRERSAYVSITAQELGFLAKNKKSRGRQSGQMTPGI